MKKIDPSYEAVKSLHFSTWSIFDAAFSQVKDLIHEINLLYDRKRKQKVEVNHKIPKIDKTVNNFWSS